MLLRHSWLFGGATASASIVARYQLSSLFHTQPKLEYFEVTNPHHYLTNDSLHFTSRFKKSKQYFISTISIAYRSLNQNSARLFIY